MKFFSKIMNKGIGTEKDKEKISLTLTLLLPVTFFS
jgi:hypothetical protein